MVICFESRLCRIFFDKAESIPVFNGRLVIFRPQCRGRKLLCRGRKFIICDSFFSKFCQISTFYSILYLILRFTKEEAEVRKQGLSFVPARYIRILTLYPKLIVFYYGGSEGSKKLLYIRILTLYPTKIAFNQGGGKFAKVCLLLANWRRRKISRLLAVGWSCSNCVVLCVVQRGASGLGGVYLQHSVRSQTHLPGRAGDGGDHAPAAEKVQEGGLCPAAAEREQEGQPETSLQTRHQVSANSCCPLHLSLFISPSIYLAVHWTTSVFWKVDHSHTFCGHSKKKEKQAGNGPSRRHI